MVHVRAYPLLRRTLNKPNKPNIPDRLNHAHTHTHTPLTPTQHTHHPPVGNDNNKRTHGLVQGHAYSILRLKKSGDFRMVLLRNPWCVPARRATCDREYERLGISLITLLLHSDDLAEPSTFDALH